MPRSGLTTLRRRGTVIAARLHGSRPTTGDRQPVPPTPADSSAPWTTKASDRERRHREYCTAPRSCRAGQRAGHGPVRRCDWTSCPGVACWKASAVNGRERRCARAGVEDTDTGFPRRAFTERRLPPTIQALFCLHEASGPNLPFSGRYLKYKAWATTYTGNEGV